MKKLLLSLTTLALLTQVNGQTLMQRYPLTPDNQASKQIKPSKTKFGKGDLINEWYFPGSWLFSDPAISSGMKGYVDFMYHDSAVKSIMIGSTGSESTIYGMGRIAVAGVLDPKDDVIDYTDNPGIKLQRNNSYKVDSIAFSYRYVRHVDSISDGLGGMIPVVDTLFITYFNGSMITKSGLTFSSPSRTVRYGKMGWTGGSVRMPNTYLWQDTVLLTKDDTTMYGNNSGGFENQWPSSKLMQLAAPASLTAAKDQDNNLVAYALTFKSMVPTVVGTDTAIMIYQKDPSTLPAGSRRTNYFGYTLYANEGTSQRNYPTFYNSSLFVESISAYTPWVVNSTVTFNGFFPGCIYTSEYFVNLGFQLSTTSGNVGIKDIKNNEFAMDVYPNPVVRGENTRIGFNLLHNATATFTMVDMLGQQVKPSFTRTYNAGQQAEMIDMTGFKAGVYFVNMTVNGSTISKKITVVE